MGLALALETGMDGASESATGRMNARAISCRIGISECTHRRDIAEVVWVADAMYSARTDLAGALALAFVVEKRTVWESESSSVVLTISTCQILSGKRREGTYSFPWIDVVVDIVVIGHWGWHVIFVWQVLPGAFELLPLYPLLL